MHTLLAETEALLPLPARNVFCSFHLASVNIALNGRSIAQSWAAWF
jgi:hypothetical protein